jgi:hypothetical protein
MHAHRAHMDQLEHALPGQLNSSSKLVAQKREENVSVVRAVQPTWYVVSCRACLRFIRENVPTGAQGSCPSTPSHRSMGYGEKEKVCRCCVVRGPALQLKQACVNSASGRQTVKAGASQNWCGMTPLSLKRSTAHLCTLPLV